MGSPDLDSFLVNPGYVRYWFSDSLCFAYTFSVVYPFSASCSSPYALLYFVANVEDPSGFICSLSLLCDHLSNRFRSQAS